MHILFLYKCSYVLLKYNSFEQESLNSGGSIYPEVLTSDSNNKKLVRTSHLVAAEASLTSIFWSGRVVEQAGGHRTLRSVPEKTERRKVTGGKL